MDGKVARRIIREIAKHEKPLKTASWNEKLSKYDLTIELASLKHLSKKMYATGKVSPKVLKKWWARDYTRRKTAWCKNHRCDWLPASAITKYKLTFVQKTNWWYCRKCGSMTSGIYDTEVSESRRSAYSHVLKSLKWS